MPAPEPFFREVESWRSALAEEIASQNSLSLPESKSSAGRIINGLLFLYLAHPEKLNSLVEGSAIYPRLLEALQGWNQILPEVEVPSATLQSILSRLLRSTTPTEIEILGQVYERQSNDSQGRKANGVFYTPPYIINAILTRTLPLAFEGRTPLDTCKLTILDPACGCGSFLLGACDWLFQWHLDWYLSQGIEPPLYKEGENWHLTNVEKARIVRDHLFGVDLDAGAVEVARQSLHLKAKAHQDLSQNIQCGNSLLGPDFEAPTLHFNWTSAFPAIMEGGGFDIVIGNPPYSNYSSRDSLRGFYGRNGQTIELEALKQAIDYCVQKYADCSLGCKDLYKWFTARSLELTKPGGYFGFIIPNTWLTQPKYADLKRKIFATSGDLDIIDLGLGVFSVVVPTCIVLARKGSGQQKRYADLKGVKDKDKPAALTTCTFQTLQDDGRVGEHPLIQRYLEEWPGHLKLKNWLTLREGQHIQRVHLKAGHARGHLPVIDSKNMGRYEFNWNPRYSFKPQGYFRTTQGQRLVVRKTGDAIVATLTPAEEAFVLQSLYQGVYLEASLAPEYLLGLLNSKFLTFIYQNSRFGQKGRVLAQFRKGHLDDLPLPEFDSSKHDLLVALVKERLAGAGDETQINALVYELYGLGEEEIASIEGN